MNGADSSSAPEQTLKFSVHSIGWAPLSEEDLQDQEASCRSINRCIMDLTAGKANDCMAQWAEVSWLGGVFRVHRLFIFLID